MLASIFDPLHRLLTSPQLAWIVVWIGLAFLIVTLTVMICTRWGASQPLRKCAALSLLAHLLLAVYATSVEIVTATNGRRGSVDVVFVDGDPDGNADYGLPEGDDPGMAIGPSNDPVATKLAAGKTTIDGSAQPQPNLAQPMPSPASPPPLLDVVKTPTPSEPDPPAPPPETEKPSAVEPSPPAVADVAPATPPDNAADPIPPPLSSDNAMSELAKLPEPPITPLNGDWVSGPPSGAAQPEAAKADPAPTTAPPPASSIAVIEPKESATAPAPPRNSQNSAASGPVVENTAPQIASRAGPQIYSDRTASDRAAILRARGGTEEGESSVQSALRWLAANQSPDGRWDADKFGAGHEYAVLGQDRKGAGAHADTGVTALALLAFLGAGNTHQRGEYALTVQHGLEFLLASQARDGNLAGEAETFAFMYCHGMASLAVSEAYAMTGDQRLEPAVKAAVNYTVGAQIAITGGWRYRANEPATEMGDTSQLGWQLMSLKSAEMAGIEMPTRTRDGIVRFIRSVSMGASGGIASYQPGVKKPSRTMTAEALVCRQFMGMQRENPASNEAGDYLLTELPSADKINLYYWYYGTLGMYQLQGDHWQRWNTAMQNTLIRRQRMDGDNAGSWDADCLWGGYGGRIYSTAMSSLCLEVYYRYLPLYRVAGKENGAQPR